jgi:hypothetical protein
MEGPCIQPQPAVRPSSKSYKLTTQQILVERGVDVLLCFALLCFALLCFAVALLCFALLCFALLCFALFFFAFCVALLCFALLCLLCFALFFVLLEIDLFVKQIMSNFYVFRNAGCG